MTTAPPAPPPSVGHTGERPSNDPPGDRPAPPPSTSEPGRRVRYVVVGLVLAGALVFLLAKGLGSALDFYLTADQAAAQRVSLGTRTFNLEGEVAPGSIHATPKGVDFVVTSGATRLQVDNTGSPPQLFGAGIPVIAVGHFQGAAFSSDQILVKHSATYIAQYPGRVTAPNGSKR